MARLRSGFILLSALFLNIMASNPATGDQGDGNGLLLYSYPYSFYAQKVLLPLYEKNLQFKIQNVDITGGENYKPWYLDINPHGEVPVLKDGVKIIPDSARIIDYLEDNFSGEGHPRLVPQDAAEKQKMNQFREKIDAINGNTVTTGTFYHPEVARDQKIPFIGPVRSSMKADYEKNGDKLRKVAEENPKARDVILAKVEAYEKTKALIKNKESYLGLLDKVDSLLTDVETELASHTDKNMWLVSKDFTVADVGLTILLQRIDLVGLSHRFWLGGKKPEVDKYFQRVQHRESFKKTMPTTWYFWKTLACKVLPFMC